jgi:hypothetical protein
VYIDEIDLDEDDKDKSAAKKEYYQTYKILSK